MKELFPLMTFHQDAVLKRLGELYDNEVDLDSRVEDLEDLPTLPLPTGQGGKVVQVKSDGSGYQLVPIEGASHLYWHGIELARIEEGDWTIDIFMVILNNSPTPFNASTLAAFIESLSNDAVFNLDGVFKDGTFETNNAFIFYKGTSDFYEITGSRPNAFGRTSKAYSTLSDFFDLFTVVRDRVNQLL